MFDIGAQEILLIVVVAILVIGPKDMPAALRVAGRWIGKMRRMSAHFRTGLDSMIREAEMEEMEKKWKAQNEKVMREHPDGGPAEMEQTGAYPPPKKGDAQPTETKDASKDAAGVESAAAPASSPPAGPDEEKKAD
jgi:sec-independent protein translocase protein TatB